MQTKIIDETHIYFFCQYQCFYYSASSSPWEAAYINCFNKNKKQIGRIIFTYDGVIIPAGQSNRMDASFAVVIYYSIKRFDDIINILRYAVNSHCCDCNCRGEKNNKENKYEMQLEEQSLFFSVNEKTGTWALCNNLYVPNGSQYHV